MALRFYILPTTLGDDGIRGPKYVQRYPNLKQPPLINEVVWAARYYGLINACIMAIDLTDADHTLLSSQSDVVAAPLDIDQNISSGAIPQVQNVLEALRIPANWINTSYTYRQVLRAIAGLFQFSGRYKVMHGEALVDNQGQLDVTWSNIPSGRQQRIRDTADDLGYDYSAIQGSWQVRQILIHLANQWSATVFGFGHGWSL